MPEKAGKLGKFSEARSDEESHNLRAKQAAESAAALWASVTQEDQGLGAKKVRNEP